MSDEEIEKSIRWVVDFVAMEKISFVKWLWHGGEPMLIGAKKFQKLTEDIKAVFEDVGCRIIFRIQTNLTLLDEEWIDVFERHYKNGIGTSLDYRTLARVDINGINYDEKVLKNIQTLQARNFTVGAITLVTPRNLDLVRDMYEFYKGYKIDFKTARYFPSACPLPSEREFILSDDAYSKFLCELFDIWVNDPTPEIRVENLLEMSAGIIRGERRLCSATKFSCVTSFLCVECGGEIYNCGRYDCGKYLLGTI